MRGEKTLSWIDFSKSIAKRLREPILDESQHKTLNNRLNGHTLVRGVAGSGKSLLFARRIERILNETDYQNILVLTYNRFMNGWLKSQIYPATHNANIQCSTFHSWAYNGIGYDYKEEPEIFLKKVERPNIKYDAILIDEAQDFKDEWFVGLLHLINPSSNSLFIVYDNTQSVYGNPHRRKSSWSWINLGINIIGRTEILRLSYRNTPEILNMAWVFILPYIKKTNIPIGDNSPGAIIHPNFMPLRSSKILPLILQYNNYDIFDQISRQVYSALQSFQDSSIAIMLPPKFKEQLQQPISAALSKYSINHHAPVESQDRNGNVVTRPCVVVDSWNALKGVEFDAVILVGVDLVVQQNIQNIQNMRNIEDEFDEISGLYAAMTRARDHLVMLYFNRNKIVEDLEQAVFKTKEHLKSININI